MLDTAAQKTALSIPQPMISLARYATLWSVGQGVAAILLGIAGFWQTFPEYAICACIATGASCVLWRSPFAILRLLVAMGLATFLFASLDLSPVLGVALAAGGLTAHSVSRLKDGWDQLNGMLASMAGAGIGLYTALLFQPDLTSNLAGTVTTMFLMGLITSSGLAPSILRSSEPVLPTHRQLCKSLRPPYRPPVIRALTLFNEGRKHMPDKATFTGTAEVTLWVYRLQKTLQLLDTQLQSINIDDVNQRILSCTKTENVDAFTVERRQATAHHLRRLLEHRERMEVERLRTDALVEYALAFLEEARAGLHIARELPGEARPDRLPDVLLRLRTHAEAGDARRQTQREIDHMSV